MPTVVLPLTAGTNQGAELSEGNCVKLQTPDSDGPTEKEKLQGELVNSTLLPPLHNWAVKNEDIQEPLWEETALKGPMILME